MPKFVSRSAIIDYWRSVELFSPQAIPDINTWSKDWPVFPADMMTPAPWEKDHAFSRSKVPPNTARRFIVYCGIYNVDKAREIIEEKIGKDSDSYDERAAGSSSLIAFSVSKEGRPLFETYTVSACAWATGRTIKPGPGDKNWLNGFDDTAAKISQGFFKKCPVEENDEYGQTLKSQGFVVGRVLSCQDLVNETNRVIKELGLKDLFEGPVEIRVKAAIVRATKEYKGDDIDFLNSFFMQDLAMVSREIRKKNIGRGLWDFLSGQEEISDKNRNDIYGSLGTIYENLSPSLFPSGRWPGKGHHPLVMSQQFAVNTMVQSLSGGAGVFSVNGPPGTGKTTLLRDLIASIIVERAKQIASLNSPKDAFVGKGRWQSQEKTREINLWKNEFKGFEIVVASSNNGAVENVTLEIPGIDSVDSSWLEHVNYFPEISARLIDDNAWALIAAKLGNKRNRTAFINQFWFSAKDVEDGDLSSAGLLHHLKLMAKQPTDWREAVKQFKEAMDREKEIRRRYEVAFASLRKVERLMVDFVPFNKLKEDLVADQIVKEARYETAQGEQRRLNLDVEDLRCQRKELLEYRPGFLEILFTLGSAIKRWRQKDESFEERISAGSTQLREIENLLSQVQEELQFVIKRISKTDQQIHELQDEINKAKNNIAIIRGEIGEAFPNFEEWADDDDARELSSPWASPEWNKARSQVFLEALNLHKAFIAANADIFTGNLYGAVDVLSGAVPTGVAPEAVESAWTTLFFVVPVVSTTFASFSRLFASLSREKIGWMLIDEGGQGVPQAAVGGMWRSRRTVVVGDPLQLEPIVTLPFTAQQALRKHFKVDEVWVPGKTSIQGLADRINMVGTYVNGLTKPIWVGSPLRVHRRCDRPMFDISNKVAYDGLMVFGTSKRGDLDLPPSAWIHVTSTVSKGHWIPEEGVATQKLVTGLLAAGVQTKEIFLISPFRDVVDGLWTIARTYEGVNLGTIHTVQGKESDVVILVLGGDPNKPGAKQWASSKPNLLNVAASRAKRRLYIIGNRLEWEKHNYFSSCVSILAKQQYQNS